jgi:heme exporter protein CcmC
MLQLGNPRRFLDVTGKLLPWLAAATAVLFAVGLWLALNVPPDYQQGDSVRIMFLHVPAAWVAMMAYGLMAFAGAVALVGRHPLADIALKTAAPLGAVFTALGLITGSLWGRPMWGAFWVWDGRLTSFLLLLFLYLGIIALGNAIEDEVRAARAAAVLAIVGAVNLPIIHFSVQWWATLHQGASILRQGGPAIAPVFLWPLAIMALAYTALFMTLWIVRTRTAILERKAAVLVATGRA